VPTRRSFLLGGAAVVAAGGVALEAAGVDRVLRQLGLRESDHRVDPSGWSVDEGSLPSTHAPASAPWAMSRPLGDAPLAGAIVCLHGRGENHRFAFDAVHLHDVVAALRLPLGVAAVDGGEHSYWHARRDGTDAGAMLLDDFVPLVRRQLGIERLAVLGWSMGGYGALLAAERRPDLFDAIVLGSPALWLDAGETASGAFDSREDFERNDVFAGLEELDPSRVRIDCGTHDPFIAGGRELARRLGPEATATFPDGYHDVPFWRSVAPAQVRFIADRLAPT